ncbi:hypothetical protein NDU88_001357 [Pleurodeles waltl]|uniref:Uncharacterized protein n=1 Tax=Pleurodeles waltl TaxID=8319 RepID=A0AAV7T012_PLEWA|nr:hypothetical protein NDU88_001357 [Pleurodeles waltl]
MGTANASQTCRGSPTRNRLFLPSKHGRRALKHFIIEWEIGPRSLSHTPSSGLGLGVSLPHVPGSWSVAWLVPEAFICAWHRESRKAAL